MIIPLAPRAGDSDRRQRHAWLGPLIFAALLLCFLAEHLILWLPPAWGLAIGGVVADLRLHSDPLLFRWWQLWTGGLVFHDLWQLVVGLVCWLLWMPRLEQTIGSLHLARALLLTLPLSSMPAVFPQALQPVSFLAGGQIMLMGMMCGAWARARSDLLIVIPRLRVIELRRLRTWFLWPCLVLVAIDLLRVILIEGMLVWPRPALAVVHSVVACSLGVLAVNLRLPRR